MINRLLQFPSRTQRGHRLFSVPYFLQGDLESSQPQPDEGLEKPWKQTVRASLLRSIRNPANTQERIQPVQAGAALSAATYVLNMPHVDSARGACTEMSRHGFYLNARFITGEIPLQS